MNIEEYTNKIREKLGEDNSAKIADDIANMLTYDNNLKKDIKDKDDEITRLKKDKEMLIEANGNLLQQIPFGKEEPKPTVDDEPKKFDFKSVFDKNGFKR